MKPKNFPAKKLLRQLKAKRRSGLLVETWPRQMAMARSTRTKKDRSSRAKI